MTTSYEGSPIEKQGLLFEEMAGSKSNKKEPYSMSIDEVPDLNGEGATDEEDVKEILRQREKYSWALKGEGEYGAGDFRSKQCVELLKQADIVVTNPPFSLFREYVALLVEHRKQFVIIGQMNQAHYKEIFHFIKDNQLWLGYTHPVAFVVPDHYEMRSVRSWRDAQGTNWRSLGNACWFTNVDVPKRHEKLPLFKKYSPEAHPTYDNYDAIEVGKVSEIPFDHEGTQLVRDFLENGGF